MKKIIKTKLYKLPCGTRIWIYNNKPHRRAGPAIIWANGDEEHYIHGKLSRKTGIAIVTKTKKEEYWEDGLLQPNPAPNLPDNYRKTAAISTKYETYKLYFKSYKI